MTALTGAYPRQRRGQGYALTVLLNASSVGYNGGLCVIDTDGYGRPGVDTASFLTAGVFEESKTGGATDGLVSAQVRFGCEFKFAATSITQAMVGQAMYLVDDNTVDDAAGATNDVFVGILTEFISTTEGWVFVPGLVQYPTSGVTSSTAELNLLDGTTTGTAVASKALAVDANMMVTGIRQVVNLAAATQTVTVAQSGETFVGLVDAVFTLPAAAAGTKGVFYRFVCGAASGGTGLSISPNASDNIRGAGLSATDNKDLINTGATDVIGDTATIVCDGADGWIIISLSGTWAKEA